MFGELADGEAIKPGLSDLCVVVHREHPPPPGRPHGHLMVISIEKGNGVSIEKGNTRYLIEIISFSFLGVFLFLGLHGFSEAVALAIHLKDVASVCEPIE
jgi:hypothetical protein